jgi:hypothetical protein
MRRGDRLLEALASAGDYEIRIRGLRGRAEHKPEEGTQYRTHFHARSL